MRNLSLPQIHLDLDHNEPSTLRTPSAIHHQIYHENISQNHHLLHGCNKVPPL